MTRLILPPEEDVAKYGPLGWVSKEERQRILDLPYGVMWPEVRRLEREIAEAKKKLKRKRE